MIATSAEGKGCQCPGNNSKSGDWPLFKYSACLLVHGQISRTNFPNRPITSQYSMYRGHSPLQELAPIISGNWSSCVLIPIFLGGGEIGGTCECINGGGAAIREERKIKCVYFFRDRFVATDERPKVEGGQGRGGEGGGWGSCTHFCADPHFCCPQSYFCPSSSIPFAFRNGHVRFFVLFPLGRAGWGPEE